VSRALDALRLLEARKGHREARTTPSPSRPPGEPLEASQTLSAILEPPPGLEAFLEPPAGQEALLGPPPGLETFLEPPPSQEAFLAEAEARTLELFRALVADLAPGDGLPFLSWPSSPEWDPAGCLSCGGPLGPDPYRCQACASAARRVVAELERRANP